MEIITAKCGQEILVSSEDFQALSQYKWHIHQGYACRSVQTEKGNRKLRMHREVLGLGLGNQGYNTTVVDHIDGNKLNNQRDNLRVVTNQQNQWNQSLLSKSSSGYKGVRYKSQNTNNPYQAVIKIDCKDVCLGSFPTPELAYIAYLEAKLKYHTISA